MGPLRRSGGAQEAVDTASDAALVTRSKRDPEVFGCLYDRYRDRILRYCFYRLGEWADAEDATNEIFARAFVRLTSFDDRGDAFAPWLFRIAHNEVVDRYRRRTVRAELPFDEFSRHVAPGLLPDEAAADSDAHDRVLALLAELPTDDQRRVCELRLAGLTGAEIAAVLGKRHDAVRQLQTRAMERLRVLVTAQAKEATGD